MREPAQYLLCGLQNAPVFLNSNSASDRKQALAAAKPRLRCLPSERGEAAWQGQALLPERQGGAGGLSITLMRPQPGHELLGSCSQEGPSGGGKGPPAPEARVEHGGVAPYVSEGHKDVLWHYLETAKFG